MPRDVRRAEDVALPIQFEDPSEAIRSSDIISRLAIGFELEHFRGYGGNVLAILFPELLVDKLTAEHVELLIRAEESLLRAGDPPFYAVVTARRKRSAPQRVIGEIRYQVEPRFPALFRELRFLKRHYQR